MPWQSLSLIIDAATADELGDSLQQLGALSISLADPSAGTDQEQALFGEPGSEPDALWNQVQLVALFEQGADAALTLRKACAQLNIAVAEKFSVSVVEEQDWVRLTQAQFDPIKISSRLWIVPTWHEAVDKNAINIALDPGVAFGTGSHPTTHLCLQWLDEHIKGGERILDYGCGSGILAIAALKLGAASAHGIDIDAQAVVAAKSNAQQNNVAASFSLPEKNNQQTYDIVLANILSNPLKVLAPLLASYTKAGGMIVLSGILEPQWQEVAAYYQAWFDMAHYSEKDGWACLSGKKSHTA
jgi:ribosomal protein L11 methyltransferase